MNAPPSARDRLASHNGAQRHLCVGLDTDVARLPESLLPGAPVDERVLAFNRAIVAATADLACAYKPNIAFYEALGETGLATLARTIEHIRSEAPDALVIIDAKRADIGSTNRGYVELLFGHLDGDAVTVHPYLGREALEPFLAESDRLVYVLARTSNPGAGEFQDLDLGGAPLYRHVARAVATEWDANANCGLVVGATYADEVEAVRADVGPDMPFLIPGVGAQGGDLEAVVRVHRDAGSEAFLINVSRSVQFASGGPDFAEAARDAAAEVDRAIRAALADRASA